MMDRITVKEVLNAPISMTLKAHLAHTFWSILLGATAVGMYIRFYGGCIQ